MADDIQIREYVDRTSVQADTEFMLEKLNSIDKTLTQVSKIRLGFGDAKGLQELKKLADQLSKVQNTLAKTTKEAAQAALIDAKASKENAAAKEREAKAGKESANTKLIEAKAANEANKSKKEEQRTRESASKAAAAEEKMIDQISNEYLQLSKAYQDAALKAKNYALTLGEQHPITVQAAKDAMLLGDVLKRVDASVGQYQRNVGNYSSAFTGLQQSMSQIVREAPALAISFQMFALAVSNNLPIFFDAVERAKKANADLAASGKAPIPIFQTLIKSITSMGGVLTIGVALFTIFSDKIVKWVQEIASSKEPLDRAAADTHKFNMEIDALTDSVQRLTDKIQFLNTLGALNVDIASTGIPKINGMINRVQDLQAVFIKTQEKAEQLGKAEKQAQEKATKAYTEAIAKLSDGDRTILFNFDGNISEAGKYFQDVNDETELFLKSAVKAEAALDGIQAQIGENREVQTLATREIARADKELKVEIAREERRLILETARINAGIRIKANEQVLSSDKSTLQQRINAIRDSLVQEKRIIEAEKRSVLTDPESSTTDRAVAIKKANAENLAATADALKDEFDVREEYRLRNLEAEKKILIQQKQQRVEALEELAENDEFTLQGRLKDLQNYTQVQKEIIDEEYKLLKESVKNKDLTDSEKLQMHRDYETKLLKLSLETQKEITSILRSELAERRELLEESVDDIARLYGLEEVESAKVYAEEVIRLNDALKNKEISYKDYLKRRSKLDAQYTDEAIGNTINEIQEQLKLYDGAEKNLSAAEINIQHLRNKLAKARTIEEKQALTESIKVAEDEVAIAKKSVDEKIALEKKLTDETIKQSDKRTKKRTEEEKKRIKDAIEVLGYLSDLLDQVTAFGQAQSDRRLQAIQAEMDKLDERYSKEKDLINQTAVNEIERKEQLAQADARYRGERQKLDQQERAENIKRARFEKQQAMFSIVLNTSRSVMAALTSTPPNVPLSIAAGIIGAAQLAVAAAQPLPRYFKGKNLDRMDSYEGPAIVDDGGRAEAIIREDGSVEVGSNKPRITYLKKNDIVLPDAKMLAVNATTNAAKNIIYHQNSDMDAVRGDLRRGFRMLNNTVKNKKEAHIIVQNPLKSWLSSNQGSTQFLNNYK
jgi:hypothetical protein